MNWTSAFEPAARLSESARVAALRGLDILDTPPDPELDDLVRVASALCDTPMALVSLVDEGRQWFKARHGLDVPETPRSVAFCDHAVRADADLVVPDAHSDPRFRDNALVTGAPHIRTYAGVVLHDADGHALGTLCVLDRRPRHLTPAQLEALRALARQAERHIRLRDLNKQLTEAQEQLARQNAALQQTIAQRNRLVSYLVHDMRNPLSLVMSLGEVLEASEQRPERRAHLRRMVRAADELQRMTADILDVQSAEEGGLKPTLVDVDLAPLIDRLCEQLGDLAPSGLERALPDAMVTRTDPQLVLRVLRNLVDNAIKYAGTAGPIKLSARDDGHALLLSVRDRGAGIPTDAVEQAFSAYGRLEAGRQGRGLGLAFCRYAVEAMGGHIGVRNHDGLVVEVTLPRG